MNKAEAIKKIATELKMDKKDVGLVVKEFLNSISKTLADGEKCVFMGFGVFEVKQRAARECCNPQDPSKVIRIPAKKVPAFRAGKDLKEAVQPSRTDYKILKLER
jgi:DNA-binding protein HU-beta